MQRALARLSDEEREAVALRFGADMTVPEIEGRCFDLICLFSVFTHLSPADYVAMKAKKLPVAYMRPKEGALSWGYLTPEDDAKSERVRLSAPQRTRR